MITAARDEMLLIGAVVAPWMVGHESQLTRAAKETL
jgi:hypothetical protein